MDEKREPIEGVQDLHRESPSDSLLGQALRAMRSAYADVFTSAETSNETWEKIQAMHRGYPAAAIAAGRKAGVAEILLRTCAVDAVMKEGVKKRDFGFIARFLQNTGMGTPDVIARFEELARRRKEQMAREKAELSKEVSDSDSIDLPSPANATMADLFQALRSSSHAFQDRFENDLEDQYDALLMPFFDIEKDTAAALSTTVEDFFGEDAEEIVVSLPLLRFGS